MCRYRLHDGALLPLHRREARLAMAGVLARRQGDPVMSGAPRDEPDAGLADTGLNETGGLGAEALNPEDRSGRETASPGVDEVVGADPGEAGAAEPARKRLGRALGRAAERAVERSAERSPRMGALAQRAQRAQQKAREGLAIAREAPTVERAFEAGRAAKEAAKPRLSRAREGMQHRVADNPEATAKVARALTIAVLNAASATHPQHQGLKKAAPAMGDHVGKAVGKLIARTQRHAPEGAAAIDAGTATGASTAPGTTGMGVTSEVQGAGVTEMATPGSAAGDATVGSAAGSGADTTGQTDTTADVSAPIAEPGATGEAPEPAELAQSLGVRPPPDPTALYREGPGTFELVLPLPSELASLPWGSLSRRNRFGALVAAWALREADGITLLKGGQLDQAGEVFQECLIRAEYVHTPELVARSYEDLAELATVSGDETAARAWRTAAAQAAGT
jgi:hypothetical protein